MAKVAVLTEAEQVGRGKSRKWGGGDIEDTVSSCGTWSF